MKKDKRHKLQEIEGKGVLFQEAEQGPEMLVSQLQVGALEGADQPASGEEKRETVESFVVHVDVFQTESEGKRRKKRVLGTI